MSFFDVSNPKIVDINFLNIFIIFFCYLHFAFDTFMCTLLYDNIKKIVYKNKVKDFLKHQNTKLLSIHKTIARNKKQFSLKSYKQMK